MWIKGDKVALKPTESSEFQAIWAILKEPGVMENLAPTPQEVTASNWMDTFIGDYRRARLYTILHAEQIIGAEVLAQIDPVHHTANIPLVAVMRKLKGNGFGVDATRALVKHGFQNLGLERISYTSIMPESKAAARANLLGARYEGTRERVFIRDGKRIDQHLFAFLKED